MSYESLNVGAYSRLLNHRSLIQKSIHQGLFPQAQESARKTIEYLRGLPLITVPKLASQILRFEFQLNQSEGEQLRLTLLGLTKFILSLPVPIERGHILRNRRKRAPLSVHSSIDFQFSVPGSISRVPLSSNSAYIHQIRNEVEESLRSLERWKNAPSLFAQRRTKKIETAASQLVSQLSLLEQEKASLDPVSVRTILQIFVEMAQQKVSDQMRSLLKLAQAHLYALNPEASVTHWLDLTGLPWFGSTLPKGHRLEGAMAMLRWLSKHESQSQREQDLTAIRFHREQSLLLPAPHITGSSNLRTWWHSMLREKLPSQVSHNVKLINQCEDVEDWITCIENHPKFIDEIKMYTRSPYEGTQTLANSLLVILDKLQIWRLERGL